MADLRVIVTGASGFGGRHLLLAIPDRMRVYALARRSPAISEAPTRDTISWLQVDIANRVAVDAAFDRIRQDGGADVLVHLAVAVSETGYALWVLALIQSTFQILETGGMSHPYTPGKILHPILTIPTSPA